ncbi:MAG: tRNA guanosine(34) transglycosylase Tgt [Planctomycetes bacterium]|nr:tRNA guanosine(34) transglycosylase Tgt [Planctomycetota bacterium]
MPVQFTVKQKSAENQARLGLLKTPHGSIDTPAFMPVATAAAMKGLTPAQVRGTGTQCILNNTLHLMLRPGDERIAQLGGAHQFMRWEGPILTDSGGFQAFSMAAIRDIDDDGVTFKSFIDGSRVRVTPERSIEAQNRIGADIIMAFDDCPPSAGPGASLQRVEQAIQRSALWLERCRKAHMRPGEQALFGIVQGGTSLELRASSLELTLRTELPGYAIGGVAVGESTQAIASVVQFTASRLPESKPRYLMGVGYAHDILMAVAAGVDLFDCVLPTRNGRNGLVFTRQAPMRLRNAVHTDDSRPIESDCDCECCSGGFSRAYLRHLFMAGEMLGPTLASLHNIRFYQRFLLDIRRAIGCNAWSSLKEAWPCLTVSPPSPDGDDSE